jgi:hypothetical protein
MRANYFAFGFLTSTLLILFAVTQGYGQTNWTEHSGNPVLDLGPPGSWDAGVVFLPHVIKIGDTLKMWYTGDSVSQIFSDNLHIGYTWSLNGINWTRYSGNPVLNNGSEPIVIQDGDTLRMWYDMGYATSVDGINWNSFAVSGLGPGPAGEWNADLFFPGGVAKVGGLFKMWFGGGTGVFPNTDCISTGYATSINAIDWMLYDDSTTTAPPYQFSDPVLLHGGVGSWDQKRAWTARVRTTPAGYEMWYAGENASTYLQAIGYATSVNGIQWTKYSGNPVLAAPGTWTNDIITPSVIRDGDQYRMWFTGFQPGYPFAGRIGYATASAGIQETQHPPIPSELSLEPNYPNSFNPTTGIKFKIPTEGQVSLKVYDVLGREVATLVDEKLPAGSYETTFTVAGLSAGLYFYQLRMGNVTKTRKLMLLR